MASDGASDESSGSDGTDWVEIGFSPWRLLSATELDKVSRRELQSRVVPPRPGVSPSSVLYTSMPGGGGGHPTFPSPPKGEQGIPVLNLSQQVLWALDLSVNEYRSAVECVRGLPRSTPSIGGGWMELDAGPARHYLVRIFRSNPSDDLRDALSRLDSAVAGASSSDSVAVGSASTAMPAATHASDSRTEPARVPKAGRSGGPYCKP